LSFVCHAIFCSVGCMNNYTTPSKNLPIKQNLARSSHEFIKHSG
jgi:hypothetical protein